MLAADHRPNTPPALIPPSVIDPVLHGDIPEREPSCSSSDLDTDSDDDFFQIEAPELARLPPIPTSEDPPVDFVTNNQDDSHLITNGSQITLSEKYLGALDEDLQSQSPAIQVMERDEAVDLSRIPSSVFARSSATPMEWSVASNESLFSIYMGSLSFSKDQMYLTGRSGDLGGFTRGLIDYPSPIPPPSMSPGTTGESAREAVVDLGKAEEAAVVVDLGKMEEAVAIANADAMMEVMKAAEKEKEREKTTSEPLGRTVSRRSDGSNTSFRSFAFPILTRDGRIGSTKVGSKSHIDNHPLSNATARKAVVVTPAATTAAATTPATPASGPGPTHASIEGSWYSCFSCCRFCC